MKRIDAPFTFQQLIDIECEFNRAVGTLGRYADAEVMARLRAADYILAEVRNAGSFLSNPQLDTGLRAEIVNRLLKLFATQEA